MYFWHLGKLPTAVRMIFPAWFDHRGKGFFTHKVIQCKPPTENVDLTPLIVEGSHLLQKVQVLISF